MLPDRSDFPRGFLFGAATSSYQIEGHDSGGAGRTHWDDFAATPGNVVNAENGALACDHYNRWPADLDLLRDANFDVYRFSCSWARVMPEGRGAVNAEGLDFYDRLIDGMLDRGLKPAATLYHWELPSALADLGGWRNRDIAGWFADYTEVLMRRIGDRVWSAAPINEPWCVSWLSHFLGQHAPGLRDIRATARAMHHVGLAHGRAIQAMRGLGMTNLGAVCNLEYARPAVSAPVDWVGLNYYTRKLIAPDAGPWPHHKEVPGPLPRTAMGWEIYPEGLEHFLRNTQKNFTGDLPIFVTENGMANADVIADGAVDDHARIAYLAAHLGAVQRAIAAGVPVAGYFTWSLMDNFEWSLGYDKRFGLVHVDFDIFF